MIRNYIKSWIYKNFISNDYMSDFKYFGIVNLNRITNHEVSNPYTIDTSHIKFICDRYDITRYQIRWINTSRKHIEEYRASSKQHLTSSLKLTNTGELYLLVILLDSVEDYIMLTMSSSIC